MKCRKWKAADDQLESDFTYVATRLKHGITSVSKEVKRESTQLWDQVTSVAKAMRDLKPGLGKLVDEIEDLRKSLPSEGSMRHLVREAVRMEGSLASTEPWEQIKMNTPPRREEFGWPREDQSKTMVGGHGQTPFGSMLPESVLQCGP